MMEDTNPEELLNRYLLGQASEKDVTTLNELLERDGQFRELYRFRIAMEGGYREAAIRGETANGTWNSLTIAEPNQSVHKSFFYVFAVAAVSLAAAALVAVAFWNSFERSANLSAFSLDDNASVARIVASIDAEWQQIEPPPGTALGAGSFRLDSGTVELEFTRGARVTVQGPARFDIRDADLLHVLFGNLLARIPEEAIGFAITTGEAEIIDLGTEFGLRVGKGGHTEVHVMEGLVQVFERKTDDAGRASDRSGKSVRIEKGEAFRFAANGTETPGSQRIPVRSSRNVLEISRRRDLGLSFLHGNIRLKESVSNADLRRSASSWIEVIPEQRGVLLPEEIPITLVGPGHYRIFGKSDQAIPAGVRVDSYLLHFRSSQPSPVQGVVKFDREIIGLVCEAGQLATSDAIVGRDGMQYPVASKQFRGLEPHHRSYNPSPDTGGGWTVDEVTISQDMKTVRLRVNVDPRQGVDQLRIIVRSAD